MFKFLQDETIQPQNIKTYLSFMLKFDFNLILINIILQLTSFK